MKYQMGYIMVLFNHKMWHLTACKISVSLSFLNWIKNEMIFYRISKLMWANGLKLIL